VVCAVCGWPLAGSFMSSQLPWSAVTRRAPFFARTASAMRPTPASTASTAWIAAGKTPVCPTMSGLAKLTRMKSNAFDSTARTTASATLAALISGFSS